VVVGRGVGEGVVEVEVEEGAFEPVGSTRCQNDKIRHHEEFTFKNLKPNLTSKIRQMPRKRGENHDENRETPRPLAAALCDTSTE
jgi:hypothetical protein